MAAGIIQGTVTTTSGETIEMSWLVDNTAAPTKWYNVSHLVNSAGVAMSDATGLLISTTQLPLAPTTAQAMAAGYQVVGLVTDQAKLPVQGNTAHDAADADNPLKGGHKATTSLAGLTLVANADVTNSFAGVDGVQIVRQHCNLEDIVTQAPVAITDGSSTAVVAAQGAGIKVYLTSVAIANTSATAVTVDLRDGTAGAVKWTFPVPANTSGVVYSFPVPLPFSANTIIAADPSAAASTITVSALGFKSKV